VDITNAGAVAGDEVVQLYVAARGSQVECAARELKAFARVSLAPGKTRTVALSVPVADVAYSDASHGWVVEPIAYEVIIARHAQNDSGLRARFPKTRRFRQSGDGRRRCPGTRHRTSCSPNRNPRY
jgi:Fibronectin type III-like domain